MQDCPLLLELARCLLVGTKMTDNVDVDDDDDVDDVVSLLLHRAHRLLL